MNKSLVGTIAILLATLFWGMTFAFIKDAVSALAPFNFLFLRFGIASLLLLIIFWQKFNFTYGIIKQGIILGIFLTGTVVFQTIGLQYTPASTASFITGFSVILVALFETFLNKQKPSIAIILAAILAITGIGFITLSNGIEINQGDFWILLCAFSFACYIICAGNASKLHQPLSLTFIQAFFICIVTGIFNVFTNGIELPTAANIWIAILFCSIFASIFAFILQLQFQKYISSTKTAIIFSLEPVFATITAAIYLNEKLTLSFFIGAGLIFIAILISENRAKQKVMPQE